MVSRERNDAAAVGYVVDKFSRYDGACRSPSTVGGDDTGAWGGSSVEGLNTIWVYEYTEKFSVIGYLNKDYLLTVN
jgi:hypothetical protein